MRQDVSHITARPVGVISDLAPMQASALYYMRLWQMSPNAYLTLQRDLSASVGLEYAVYVGQSLQNFSNLYASYGRRDLAYHAPKCEYLGADEACLANLIAYAAQGQREDAALMASLIVRPDFACMFVGCAQNIGCAFHYITQKISRVQGIAAPTVMQNGEGYVH